MVVYMYFGRPLRGLFSRSPLMSPTPVPLPRRRDEAVHGNRSPGSNARAVGSGRRPEPALRQDVRGSGCAGQPRHRQQHPPQRNRVRWQGRSLHGDRSQRRTVAALCFDGHHLVVRWQQRRPALWQAEQPRHCRQHERVLHRLGSRLDSNRSTRQQQDLAPQRYVGGSEP